MFVGKCYKPIHPEKDKFGLDINGESQTDFSGTSVSISANGSIIAIGAIGNNGRGHVRVYEFNNGFWIQQGEDLEGEMTGDRFGNSVSLSEDGSSVAIGGNYNSENGSHSGHVRIYRFENGVWVLKGSDIDGIEGTDESGWSVSLASTGRTVAVGSPYNGNNNQFDRGHVRVFYLICVKEDLNYDGTVNAPDVLLFLGLFGTSCVGCRADFDKNGFINSSDFLSFLSKYTFRCF